MTYCRIRRCSLELVASSAASASAVAVAAAVLLLLAVVAAAAACFYCGCGCAAAAAAAAAAATALLLVLPVFFSSFYSLAVRIYNKKCTSMPRCAAAVVAGAPTKEYTFPYSMMHRRLTTSGIEVAPHNHQ